MAGFGRKFRQEFAPGPTVVTEPKPTPVPTHAPARAEGPGPTNDLVVRPREPGEPGPAARILARLVNGPAAPGDTAPREVDLTHPITAAIACELWKARGGTSEANWAQAESFVERLALPSLPPGSDAARRTSVGMEPAAR